MGHVSGYGIRKCDFRVASWFLWLGLPCCKSSLLSHLQLFFDKSYIWHDNCFIDKYWPGVVVRPHGGIYLKRSLDNELRNRKNGLQ